MNLKIKNKIKLAPPQPGIYFWLGRDKKILYVGRANNLRQRLSQYTRSDLDAKIAEMTERALDIKYLVTDNILESVILEAKNIKKYWPKYNVVNRDDRSFIYLVLPKTDYPRPLIIRGREAQKLADGTSRVFGPYQSYHLLKNALKIIRRIFPYSLCVPGSGRPCFDYQIGLCPGICIKAINRLDYQKNLNNIALLLAGRKKQLLKTLGRNNPAQLKALQQIQDVALMAKEVNHSGPILERLEAYDISHHHGRDSFGSMVVFTRGQADTSQYRLFKIKTAPAGDDERALAEVLSRRFNHPDWPRPDLIVIDGGRPQISFLKKFLEAKNIALPLVGISKLAGDQLVFPIGLKTSWRLLISNLRPVLLRAREEAHRFANYGRKRSLRINVKNKKGG